MAIPSHLPQIQVASLLALYDGDVRARRRTLWLALGVLAFCILVAGQVSEIDLPKFLTNFHSFPNYILRIFFLESGAVVFSDVAEWFWGLKKWLLHIGDTLLIAYLGTLIGALGAFYLSFSAAANLAKSPTRRFIARRILEFCRTVPELVFALIFVVAFGLGPVPGVLAIAIHTFGALGKLFAEVVENIDMKPVEGILAGGATRWQAIRFAVVPQVLSNFASYGLLRFEINVRGASVMGFVGAGGIGQELIEAVRKFYYSDISAILLLIIGTVILIDLGTEHIRRRLLSAETGR
ncbi:MAG: phosphonate ABC transporter, permease protein PhnE [Rhizobiales bacterium PAR1]|nr:MAG: phosphonate ABC transporter, permease protein PhnE [Rhizobiales bacterium PAR1]